MADPIKVALIGFAEAVQKSLQIALQNRSKGQCILVEASDQADVALVDIDAMNSPDEWQRLPASIRLIAVSDKPVSIRYRSDFSGFIRKPLRFTQMLHSISEVMQSESIRSRAQAIERSQQSWDKIRTQRKRVSTLQSEDEFIDLKQYLLGQILDKVKLQNRHSACLISWAEEGQWIVYNHLNQRVYLGIEPKVLRHRAIESVQSLKIQSLPVLNEELKEYMNSSAWQCDLEEFLWRLTYWTVRGRRLKELDLDQVYMLRAWPNIPRYSQNPVNIPLSSYWTQVPASINELMEKFKFKRSDVLSYAACCYLAGLLVTPDQQSVQYQPPPEAPKGLKRVLRLILNKLGS